MKRLWMILLLGMVFNVASSHGQTKGDSMAITEGSKVKFDYVLKVDGNVMDSSEGIEPLEYVQGDGGIIPGLAKQLDGMKAGDEKDVTVEANEAYGDVDPAAFKEVPRTQLPEGMEPEPGMMLQARGPDGRPFPVKIAEVKDAVVVMDFNHPLAGKTLDFHVKIVSVE